MKIRPVITRAATLALLVSVPVLGMATAAHAVVDEQPPTVSITAPFGSTVIEGVVTVQGSATDNKKVKRVEVGVDGANYKSVKKVKRTSNWYLNINSAVYTDGSHYLTVRASDRRGNVGTASVPVTFANDAPLPDTDPAPTDAPTDPAPTDSRNMTTPEGTVIEITSAGAWTAEQIYQILKENGLDSTIGPTLTVKVQDSYSSQASTLAQMSNGVYTSFKATIYLKGVDSTFAVKPNYAIAHEFGHVWTLYHLYMSQAGDWSSYLLARGLAGETLLDSSYGWSRGEIIAEDYRLLFGSESAIAEAPRHLNYQIPDPREVPGLREFFLNTWAVPK